MENKSTVEIQTPPEPESNKLILPDGLPSDEPREKSQRQHERKSEDEDYVPVIIKRTDETRRHPDDALNYAIKDGIEQLKRPPLSLLLSAIAGGLIVGFSAMAVAVVYSVAIEMNAPLKISRLATALVYPLGFILCILSGAQLFTEHTATALYPVLDSKANIAKLLRLWVLVVIGNLVGAAGCGLLHCQAIAVTQAEKGYIAIGEHLTEYSTASLFISSLLAGWLMALGAWLVGISPRTIAQIAVIYIVTFLIGVGGLHHSIAGSVEMFTVMFLSPDFTAAMTVRFIAVALVGNLVGGSCFVALLNYAHIRRTNE